jgi:hypothetical protein
MPQKRGGNKTQKKKHTKSVSQPLTIPELRRSIEHITAYTEQSIQSGSNSVKSVAASFAAEWKKVFGKSLKPKVAEDYIKSMMKLRKGKQTRKQRGGMASVGPSGAPLDYLTRPGVDLPYGKFLEYVDKGFVNPEPAILKDCGTQQGILPQAGMGSNKMSGGGFLDAALMRPFVSSTPMSVQHDTSMAWKAQPLPPGPEAWQKTWQPHMSGAALNNTYVNLAQVRDLTKDILPLK